MPHGVEPVFKLSIGIFFVMLCLTLMLMTYFSRAEDVELCLRCHTEHSHNLKLPPQLLITQNGEQTPGCAWSLSVVYLGGHRAGLADKRG